MVATTAYVVTKRLAPPTATDFVLTAYLVSFVEIVAIVLALSVVRGLYSWTVLAGLALVLVAALSLCYRTTHTARRALCPRHCAQRRGIRSSPCLPSP